MVTGFAEKLRLRVLAVVLAVLLAVGGLTFVVSSPANAYETPVLYSTWGLINVGGGWGSINYSRTPSYGYANKAGYFFMMRVKWTEHGTTAWTSYRANDRIHGGAIKVYAYYSQALQLKY